jgi:serine/threonine protein kinase/Tol biopolymer transport system component
VALAAGTRLGPYEILAAIGAGGMGEVYRARDTRLKREVALKVLPTEFSQDPDRLARFQREAELLATLNHPNIAHIYGLEQADGIRALAMELVEGPTLADRIAQGPVPLDEALPVAQQLAEALGAAHEQEIIHRDLKPANIKVRADGTVKVLDFGLAKALEPAALAPGVSPATTNSPTITTPAMTGIGVILGTAAYMSPEQAKGRAVDKRSDIWAFGCVLFEILTATRAFEGDDVSDTLASVLKSEPNWEVLPGSTPTAIRRLLRRCLDKDRTHRLADISDARLDLEEAGAFHEPVSAAGMRRPTSTMWRSAAFAIVGALIAGVFIGWTLTRSARENLAISRLSIDLTPADHLAALSAETPTRIADLGPRPIVAAIALSPDGRTLVFSGTRGTTTQLFSRSFDQSTATPLAGTEGAVAPFFSPDGRGIAFFTTSKLKKVPAGGGPAIDICNVALNLTPFGASWGSKETIAFSTGSRIFTVSASGGTPREIVKADRSNGLIAISTPQWLPRETALLYTARSSDDWTQARIVAQPTDGGASRTLVTGAADARYVTTGHLLYMKLGTLVAAPFDPARLQITGAPVALLDDVMQAVNAGNSGAETGAGQFAVAPAGTLAYVAGGVFPDFKTQLVWTDRHGVETPLRLPPGPILSPRLSLDEHRLTYVMNKSGSREADIWAYDLARDVPRKLTFVGTAFFPMWAPDGRHILFVGSGGTRGADLYWLLPDSGGPPEGVMAASNPSPLIPSSASATGLLALVTRNTEGRLEVSVLPLGGDRKSALVLQGQGPANVAWPAFSSDGRWLAYASDESGQYEVYVQAYPGPGDKHRLSRGGGDSPVWARNGRELFYQARTGSGETAMMAVNIDTTSGLRSTEPHALFSIRSSATIPVRGYDVSPDGQRFIMAKDEPYPVTPVTSVHIVLNWSDELKQRVPLTR